MEEDEENRAEVLFDIFKKEVKRLKEIYPLRKWFELEVVGENETTVTRTAMRIAWHATGSAISNLQNKRKGLFITRSKNYLQIKRWFSEKCPWVEVTCRRVWDNDDNENDDEITNYPVVVIDDVNVVCLSRHNFVFKITNYVN